MSTSESASVEAMLAELIELISETGADLMVGSFQGGNDEGGIDDITLYRRRESTIVAGGIETEEVAYEPAGYSWTDPIYAQANDLMSTAKYGGWAWEGNAWGTFTVDCKLRRAWEDGTETTEVPIVDPLVVQL